jgi:hypothetical protein
MSLERKDNLFLKALPNGKESASLVSIKSEVYLSQGAMGSVSVVEAEVKGKKKSFVLKKFKDKAGLSAKELAKNAYDNYNNARKSGLRVFPTYRLSAQQTGILMTNGNLEGFACIGTNQESPKIDSKEFGLEKLNYIENFSDLIEILYEQAENSALAKIRFHDDCFMFLVNKGKTSLVDVVIGDMDNVTKTQENTLELKRRNFFAGLIAFKNFIQANMNKQEAPRYEQLIDAQMKKYF